MAQDALIKSTERLVAALIASGSPAAKAAVGSIEAARSKYEEAVHAAEEKSSQVQQVKVQARLFNGLLTLAAAVVVVARRMKPDLASKLPPAPAPSGADGFAYADAVGAALAGQGEVLEALASTLGGAVTLDRENVARVKEESAAQVQAESDRQILRLELQRAITDAAVLVHRTTAPGSPARELLKRRYKRHEKKADDTGAGLPQ